MHSKKEEGKIYGMELILELFNCDLETISSKKKIQEFIKEASKKVKLNTYGPARIKRFMGGGLFGMGYSFLQFLSVSSMTGHFIENDSTAFLNVFSCSIFDDKEMAKYAKSFFKAKKINVKLIIH